MNTSTTPAVRVGHVNKAVQLLLFFLFVINTAAALWSPLFSVFIVKHIIGATLITVGATGALYSVVKSVMQIPVARRLDKRVNERDDFRVIFAGISLACVCSFSLLFISQIWQLGIIQGLWGVADAFTMAAYYAIFSHHLDKRSAAFEWSLYSVGGVTAGGAIGGLIGGFVTQSFGFTPVFLAAGLMNALGLVLLVLLKPHMKSMRPHEALSSHGDRS